MKRIALAGIFCFLASVSFGQTPVKQSGTVTPGHVPMWTTNGVIQDGGTAAQGSLTSLGVTASGPSICANSGPITAAYNQICLDSTSTGMSIDVNNQNGATGGLTIKQNGSAVGFPAVRLPVSANDVACFFDTSGTLKDCSGIIPSGYTIPSPTLTGTVTGPDGGTWGLGGFNGSAIGATTPEGGKFTTGSFSGNLTTNITGTTQCVTANSSGVLIGAGFACNNSTPDTPHTQDFVASNGDFTPGTTTSLTLSFTPAAAASVQVAFDGITQSHDTWSLSTATITFNSAIPLNVQVVDVQYSVPTTIAGVSSVNSATGSISIVAGTNMTVGTVGPTITINGLACGIGIDCASVAKTASSQGPVYFDVKLYGAKDDCSTDDTSAFQDAINAAAASGGAAVVYIPPITGSGGCYLVGAINATNKPHLIIRGNGDASLVEVHGSSPTNNNWWDLSGSNDSVFENFKVLYDGSTVPSVIFFASAVAGVDVMHGIIFKHVSIDVHASQAVFYGYALTGDSVSSSVPTLGSSAFACYDSEWIQRNQGTSNNNPSLRDTVVDFDGINSRGLASDYVTVSTLHAGDSLLTLNNCTVIDAVPSAGGGIEDNNASLVMVNAGQFNMRGGAALCLCEYDVVVWNDSEDIRFDTMQAAASDGTVTVIAFFDVGGGTNGLLSLQNVFFSVPKSGGGFINFDAPSGGSGGITGLNLFGPDIGGNNFNDSLITNLGGCTGFTPSNDWILNSYIQAWVGANNIAACGSIDSHTIIQNPGSVSLPAGATDNSHHF